MELSAKDFYRHLAEKFPQEKPLFNQLADEEALHAIRYEKLLTSELKPEQNDHERTRRNIKILNNSGIIERLRNSVKLLENINTVLEALELSAKLEKETEIYFFNSLGVYGELDRDVVQKILLSEHEHWRRINSWLNEYKARRRTA